MAAGQARGAAALSVRAVGKVYPPASVVLRGVDLELSGSKVHGLLGANGAGKSTLIKVLCGLEQPTSGGIWMDGRGEVRFGGPREAERAGIGVVHQELPLLPNLTAAENMVLGQQSGAFLSSRKRRAVEAEYRRQAEMFPGAPPPDALLGHVGLHGWQMTAIIRARYFGSRVVILDEPTSSLDAGERRTLHDNLRRMAVGGAAILYVSHFLEDILDVCDSVTVLRDGRGRARARRRGTLGARSARRHDRRSGGRGRRHACAELRQARQRPGPRRSGSLAPRRGTAGFYGRPRRAGRPLRA